LGKRRRTRKRRRRGLWLHRRPPKDIYLSSLERESLLKETLEKGELEKKRELPE